MAVGLVDLLLLLLLELVMILSGLALYSRGIRCRELLYWVAHQGRRKEALGRQRGALLVVVEGRRERE